MAKESALTVISKLSESTLGGFRGDPRGQDPTAPRGASDLRLSTRVPTRVEGTRASLRLRLRSARTILETNGRRWHDDPLDYERDNEKWSVPGRLGYSVVFGTWNKVNQRPGELIEELAAALAA